MPELPEVETIRRGLHTHLVRRQITGVQVLHPRAVRRHVPGGQDLADRLRGQRFDDVARRGKDLWLDAADSSDAVAVVVHMAPNPVIPRA